uniref:Sel1 repeat-containing protein n=1 Tax=Palpitomonas bilix TaxID=652834 RepID=A0A7S3DJK6_9EUKA|mmetsp:Transcript_39925/g.103018  ORF Transcript_39925/g.103018 Transcript_39925/m.103018 type:complete len:622 (+) Transcript_39925:798-2663(+)
MCSVSPLFCFYFSNTWFFHDGNRLFAELCLRERGKRRARSILSWKGEEEKGKQKKKRVETTVHCPLLSLSKERDPIWGGDLPSSSSFFFGFLFSLVVCVVFYWCWTGVHEPTSMTVGEPTSLYIQWTSSLFVVFLAGFVTTLVVRFVSPNQHQDRGGGGGVFSLRVGVCHAFRCSRLLFSRVWKTLWNKNGDGNACSSLCSSLIPFGLFETERCLLFPKVGVWRTLCGLQTRISPSLAFHQQHLMSPSPTIFPPEDPSDTPKTPLSPSGSSCSKERTEPFQKSQREKKKKRRGPVANEQTGDSTSKQRDKDENSMCRENKNGPRTIPLVACASPPLFSASPPLLEWEKQEKDSPARPLPTRKRKGTADAKIVVTHGSSLRSRFESLWEKERRTRVQKWLRVARLTDTGEAEFQLGLLHGGKDVPSSLLDRETSFSWFLASANKGWKEAFLPTGLCLLQGRGTDVDEQQAFRWFLRGAERLGNVECCFWVGSCYLQGVGVDPNPVDGKQWVERAAKGEHVEAMKLLGQTYAKEASDLQEGISRSLVDSFLLGGDNRDGQQKNTTKSVPHPPSLCSFSFPFSFPSSSSSSSLFSILSLGCFSRRRVVGCFGPDKNEAPGACDR